MSTITKSSFAMRLFLQKQYSAALYAQASRSFGVYSQKLGKTFGDFSAVDSGQAALIQGCILPALADEGQHGITAVSATLYPIPIDLAVPPKPEEAEGAVIGILEDFVALEGFTAQFFQQAVTEKAAEDVSLVLDLRMTAAVSSKRASEIKRLGDNIKSGDFWQRSAAQWHCLRCGHSHLSVKAFEKCACCNAPRAFASA